MARPLRLEFTRALYHATARGNERRSIFPGGEDEDRAAFLGNLAVVLRALSLDLPCPLPDYQSVRASEAPPQTIEASFCCPRHKSVLSVEHIRPRENRVVVGFRGRGDAV